MAEEKKKYSSKKAGDLGKKLSELSIKDNQAIRLLAEHVDLVKQDIGRRAASRKQSSSGHTPGLHSLGDSPEMPEGYSKRGRGSV